MTNEEAKLISEILNRNPIVAAKRAAMRSPHGDSWKIEQHARFNWVLYWDAYPLLCLSIDCERDLITLEDEACDRRFRFAIRRKTGSFNEKLLASRLSEAMGREDLRRAMREAIR